MDQKYYLEVEREGHFGDWMKVVATFKTEKAAMTRARKDKGTMWRVVWTYTPHRKGDRVHSTDKIHEL